MNLLNFTLLPRESLVLYANLIQLFAHKYNLLFRETTSATIEQILGHYFTLQIARKYVEALKSCN